MRPHSLEAISRMLATIAYRGPDHEGSATYAGVQGDHLAVGQKRLAIVDPSPEAHQPFENDRGSSVLTFNGEFYNFRRLREACGGRHRFRTHSDVEVALYLLDAHGIGALSDLWGMFAGAYYNLETSQLLLFRDRMGKKPLYYTRDGDRFIFASEPKAILACLDHLPDIDSDALLGYFMLGYIPDHRCAFQSIQQVPPGHALRIGPDLQPHVERWYIPNAQQQSVAGSFEELFLDAIALRMISDRPLGAFLSGGLDSSLVVAAMSRLSSSKINTFCVRFRGPQALDESPFARQVAAHCQTDHHEISLGTDTLLESVEEVLDHFDEPFGDSSAIPMYVVSREARRHFTVALTGDGADETHAGYRKYLGEFYLSRLGPYGLRRGLIRPLLSLLPTGRTHPALELCRRARRLLQGDAPHAAQRHVNWLRAGPIPGTDLVGRRFTREQCDRFHDALVRRLPENPNLNDLLLFDQELVLVNDMFVKVDRMSMKASLEVRSPFVDHRLVEFANGLSPTEKLRGNVRKHFLIKQLGHFLPADVLSRPKSGFELPLGAWLRQELRDWAEDRLFHHSDMGDWVNLPALRRVWKRHLSGRLDCTEPIWFHLVFSSWLRRYQDGSLVR